MASIGSRYKKIFCSFACLQAFRKQHKYLEQVYSSSTVLQTETRQVLQWTPGSQIHCSNQKIILSKK